MEQIDYAKSIVTTLKKAGHIAYFAGGWVRDFVMGHPSFDIDIATSASTDEIQKIFPKTIPVGIAFGVVIVIIRQHPFEVSTFRKDEAYLDGRRPIGIKMSSPQEDAKRRDFTINGMFYDPTTDTVIDFVNGGQDIEKRIIQTIGDPQERFHEDRLRMIRAVRFASRFDFTIEQHTQEAIQTQAHTLFPAVAIERIWQEWEKMMTQTPNCNKSVEELFRLGLLQVIFPELSPLDLNIIKQRICSYQHFALETPAILYLLKLFPENTLEESIALCQKFKLGRENIQHVILTFLYKTLQHNSENIDWARFYANENADIYVHAAIADLPDELRLQELERHLQRQQQLVLHTERIRKKQPVVTSHFLRKHDIVPSKLMGELLREAERIAVNFDLHDEYQVLKLLTKTPLWPQ